MRAPWRDRAWEAIRELAASGAQFTADDLIDMVGAPDPSHAANSTPSSVGSLFTSAQNARLIVFTGKVTQSRQKHRKGGAVRIWIGYDYREPAESVGQGATTWDNVPAPVLTKTLKRLPRPE